MTRSVDEQAAPPAVERAAALGEQVGRFTSLVLRRIEAVARTGISRRAAPAAPEASDQAPTEAIGTAGKSATERAEDLLDGTAERLNQLAVLTGPGIRRFVALAREEAEDIWAEAQHIRRSNSRDSG